MRKLTSVAIALIVLALLFAVVPLASWRTAEASPDTHTYNFVDITAASGPHDAYYCDVDAMPPADNSKTITGNLNVITEATDAEYTAISASDDSRWLTPDPGWGDEALLWLDMIIDEDPADITNINLTFEGYSNDAAVAFEIWAYNNTSGAWEQIGADENMPSGADGTMTRSITSGFSNYIDGTGLFTWGAYSNGNGDPIQIDFVEMVVSYTPPNARPAAPTLHDVPFPNEETPDTTPSFEFTADDPDGSAGIVYQIQWDTDPDFGSATTNTSDTDAGFENTVNSSDDSPFNEGEKIRFTIQDADALSNSAANEAFYWQVRAKDDSGEGGSGNFGSWTTRKSFRVNTSLDQSQWVQTTDEQFETGTPVDTETTGSGSVQLPASSGSTNWGDINNPGGTSSAQSTARAMGGTSPDVDNMVVTSISIWWGGTGTGRLAVYQGGALDNPTGASLVWDAGEVAIPETGGWVTISGGNASLTKNTVTWLAFKTDNANYYYSTSWDSASDFQSGRGRAELTAEGGASTDAWDATVGTYSFGNYWYDIYITYETEGPSSGTIESPQIDFDWVPNMDDWDEVQIGADTTNGSITIDILDENGGDTGLGCTISGGSSSCAVDISSLDPAGDETQISILATLTDSGGTPYLNDWTVTWKPPAAPGIPTVSNITISPISMTPQEQWTNITVPVTDNNTLADVNEVHVEVFYDSAGNDTSAPGTADVQTCAILTWTRGGSPVWSLDPASTTWQINTGGCSNASDTLTTGNWVFSFKVGKVATHSPGSDDWDIYAKATDSISQTGDNYLRDVEMNWYGEIAVETSNISWGTVTPGCSNETSPVVNITYICNGNYTEQVKTSQNWTSASGNVTLNTTGSPGTGEFSLLADDDNTTEEAVQVLSASYTTFDTGNQTTEAGNAENNNHLWLSLGSGIPAVTYSGTIYFGIAP